MTTASRSGIRAIGPFCEFLSPGSLLQRFALGSVAIDPNVAIASDDEDDVAEVVALLASARLVPTSSRRPIAAMLCAAGIGSAEDLLHAVDHNPSFLSNQVLLCLIAG